MISAFVISQILVGVAFISDIASFQFKERKITLLLFGFSASLIAAHFFLLGATTAGFVVAVSAVRFIVSAFTTSKKLMYVFLILTFVLGVWTYDGYEDVLITGAILLSTVAAFQVNEKRLRQIMMIVTSIVIVHNVIIFTPAGILLESFFLGSNVVSYWRFYLRDDSKKDPVADS